MSQFLSGISLDQIKCQQHYEIANLICLNKDCQKRGVICAVCQEVYHKDHQVKPFKYFLHQLTRSQKHSNRITLITAEIDLISAQISAGLTQIANGDDRNDIQKVIRSYTQKLNEKIFKEYSIQEDLRAFFQDNRLPSVKRLNDFITQYQLHEYESQIPVDKPMTNQEKYLCQIRQMLRQKREDFQELLKTKAQAKDLLSIFTFTQTRQRVSYTFSEELKHSCIKLTDKVVATQSHNYSSNFVLIQPMIMGKKKQFSKKTVKIKMQKLNSWINLGICLKNKVCQSSYYFNTQQIGHGAYTISNDGYSWHNTDSTLNSFYHGWSFVQGDTVQMTYDPKKKVIKYSKQNQDRQHELACEYVTGEEMYFCVTLNTHDQSVSIVQ